jgi:hypothetical protein
VLAISKHIPDIKVQIHCTQRILKISPHYNLIENNIFADLKIYIGEVFVICIIDNFGLNSVEVMLAKTHASVIIKYFVFNTQESIYVTSAVGS